MILMHGANSLKIGGRENSHLPEHCILLDYFIDDHHYGIQKVSSSGDYGPTFIADSGSDKLSTVYFNTQGTPWNNLPYMKMHNYNNGVRSNSLNIRYSVPFNSLDEYTVELFAAVDTSNTAQIFNLGPLYNLWITPTIPTIRGGYLLGNGSGSAIWFNGNGTSISNCSNSTYGNCWHHYCYTKSNLTKEVNIYLDGTKIYTLSSSVATDALRLEQCPIDYTNGTTLFNSPYYVAQLTVWNDIHYTSNFTVPRKLHYV